MQTLLTAENLIVGPPEIRSFGRPAVELVSVCCQNQPASTGGRESHDAFFNQPSTAKENDVVCCCYYYYYYSKDTSSNTTRAARSLISCKLRSACWQRAPVIPHTGLIHHQRRAARRIMSCQPFCWPQPLDNNGGHLSGQ